MDLTALNNMYPDLGEYVDVKDGLNRLMKKKNIYKTVMKSFTANTHIDELSDQMSAGQFEDAQRSAHTIKGLAANLSLPKAYTQSAAMDARFKAGETDLSAMLAELGETLRVTVNYIGIIIQNIDDIEC